MFFPAEAASPDCTELRPVEHEVKDASISTALATLFEGPADRSADDLGGVFGSRTRGLLSSVDVHDGTAYVNLQPAFTKVNNINTTCGATSFMAAVQATAQQFPGVRDVTFAVDGDPATFYNFMQIGCPEPSKEGDRCDPTPFQSASSATASTTTPPASEPGDCRSDAPPDHPAPVAKTFVSSWQAGDQTCANAIGTPDAVDELFATSAGPGQWVFVACTPHDATDPHTDCYFGDADRDLRLVIVYSALNGWSILDVEFDSTH